MTFLPAALVSIALLGSANGQPTPGAPGPQLTVTSRAPAGTHLIGPGQTAAWAIGVTTAEARLESLTVTLTAEAGQNPALDEFLTFSVRGCTSPWKGSRCPARAIDVAPSLRTAAWRDHRADIALPDGAVPEDIELLVVATMAGSATNAVQGAEERLTVQVNASGTAQDRAAFGNPMAQTGFALWPALLLAFGAIAAGIAFAGLGRWLVEIRR